jgi:hypothetical protein
MLCLMSFRILNELTGKGWVLELATGGGGAYKAFDVGDGNTVSVSTEVLKGSGAQRKFWAYS